MMYKVSVVQKKAYNEEVCGTFSSYEDIIAFVEIILENFDNATVKISKEEQEEKK